MEKTDSPRNPIVAPYVGVATTTYRTVQPYEVLEVEQVDLYHLPQERMRIPTDEATELSLTTNTLVAISSRDGHRIANEDAHAAVQSTKKGLMISEQIDRKILLANYDTPVFDPPASATEITSNPYVNASAPPLRDTNTSKRGPHQGHESKGGYVIPEYRSIYDDPTASTTTTAYEYKSMYDP